MDDDGPSSTDGNKYEANAIFDPQASDTGHEHNSRVLYRGIVDIHAIFLRYSYGSFERSGIFYKCLGRSRLEGMHENSRGTVDQTIRQSVQS